MTPWLKYTYQPRLPGRDQADVRAGQAACHPCMANTACCGSTRTGGVHGHPRENIIIPEIGQVIELSADSIAGRVGATGTLLIDGLGIGDVGNVVLRDRKHLSQDGLIIVAMALTVPMASWCRAPMSFRAGLCM